MNRAARPSRHVRERIYELAGRMVEIADDSTGDFVEMQGPDGSTERISNPTNILRARAQVAELMHDIEALLEQEAAADSAAMD